MLDQLPKTNGSLVSSSIQPSLIDELHNFARTHVNELAFSKYVDAEIPDPNFDPIHLPTRFSHLTCGCKEQLYIVGFEDRQDSYYKEGTRSVSVTLSTSRYKYFSNDSTTEIVLILKDPSERRDGKYEVAVSRYVNNTTFRDLNSARGLDVDHPHGQSKFSYSIDSAGKFKLTGATISRLDEGVVSWRGNEEVARWLRYLVLDNGPGDCGRISYEDSYLIKRDKNGQFIERAKVETEIDQRGSEFDKISMKIGVGNASNVIYQSPEGKLTIAEATSDGMRACTNQREIIASDIDYGELLGKSEISEFDFLRIMRKRVDSLMQHWDKAHSVLGSEPIQYLPGDLRELTAPSPD